MSIAELPTIQSTAISTFAEIVRELGDVPLDRILAIPAPGTATEKDLLYYLDEFNLGCELVDGVLVVKAMGFQESVLGSILSHWINTYLDKNPLGACGGEHGICKLIPGLVRAPDVSFISRGRLAQESDLTFAPGAPELCVEVLSKSNTRREVERKIKEYFRYGCQLVWVFDIRKQLAQVYRSPADVSTLGPADELSGADVLPGFRFVLGDLFAALQQRMGTKTEGPGHEV